MSFDIRYLPLADEDIEALAVYLSRFYPSTVGKVLNKMEQQISSLSEQPHLYEECEADHFYRKIAVDEYLVFYHVNEENRTIDIHRVLRSSWDIDRHLPKGR